MKIQNNQGKDIDTLDLGIVEAGTSKEYEFLLFNETNAEVIEISVEIKHEEVTVLSSPDKLGPKRTDKLKIKWTPSLTVKQGLKTPVKVSGVELYKP